MWRQSSIMSAVLAQFISDRTGQNAVDDGTTATLLANLKLAAAALNGDAAQTFSVAPATQSQHAVNLGQFANSLVTSGYSKLPNGLILQWGVGTLPNSGARTSSVTVTLPLAWPASTLFSAVANANGAANSSVGGLPVIGATSNTSSSITFTADTLGYTTFNQTMTFLWFAIGK
ncbi:hypothetical protein DIE16_31370 [Burkholderia sp. Bp9090]|nr:hypothetical protein DIE16_31370 [Burkholderia sp. Bp9090]